jgi:hypothetical protein
MIIRNKKAALSAAYNNYEFRMITLTLNSSNLAFEIKVSKYTVRFLKERSFIVTVLHYVQGSIFAALILLTKRLK